MLQGKGGMIRRCGDFVFTHLPLEEEVLGELFLRCVRIQLLRPGCYFGYEILHSQRHGTDKEGASDALP